MKGRRLTLKLLALVSAAMCMGATFTWDSGGADDDWDTCDNWSGIGLTCCYPCTTSDDGIIAYDVQAVPWTVDLTTEIIGNLSVNARVNFYPADASNTLTVNETFTLTATQAATVVTMNSGGKIVTQ